MTQRLRVTYRKAGPARYVAHLDLMRTWERAIRRARLPLAYTQGFSPHARLQLAAPLPVGTAGERELLDLWVDPAVPPTEARARLEAALPEGLGVVAVEEVPASLPALQAATRAARYEARFAPGAVEAAPLRAAAERLLALETLDWEEERGERTRRYDLRATVLELAVRDAAGEVAVDMRLAMEPSRTGRPASVLAALGCEVAPLVTVRTTLELADAPTAPTSPMRAEG